jgi:hypothetical protein
MTTNHEPVTAFKFHELSRSGEAWTSPLFDGDERQAHQGVIGGWLAGHVRWATDAASGRVIYALDRRGRPTSDPLRAAEVTP